MNTDLLNEKWKTHQYSIPFDSLEIISGEIARFMGYTEGMLPKPFEDDLNNLIHHANDHVCIEGGFRVLSPETVNLERDRFRVEDKEFETGRIIAGPLRGSESLAFFAVTAGPGITQWTNKFLKEKEHVLAFFVDALGSQIVEKAADFIEEQISEWASAQGKQTTNRYSPGYCEWSVSEQHKLFSFLPDTFCGITLTESALMQPTKSVSGVIGIGDKAKKRAYACSICDMEDCFRRNMGH